MERPVNGSLRAYHLSRGGDEILTLFSLFSSPTLFFLLFFYIPPPPPSSPHTSLPLLPLSPNQGWVGGGVRDSFNEVLPIYQGKKSRTSFYAKLGPEQDRYFMMPFCLALPPGGGAIVLYVRSHSVSSFSFFVRSTNCKSF